VTGDPHCVQIINMVEQKAVSFRFENAFFAEAFEAALHAVFASHEVEAVVGSYREGELCPRHTMTPEQIKALS
jgi:hypothetical protein